MVEDGITRRQTVQAVGLGGIGAISGCLGSASGKRPAAWIPSHPDGTTYPGGIRIHSLEYARNNQTQEVAEFKAVDIQQELESALWNTTIPSENLRALSMFYGGFVAGGDIDADRIRTSLREEGFDQVGEYSGYTLFTNPENDGWITAVGDKIVYADGQENHVSRAKRTIDTSENGDHRWVDSDDIIATIFDTIGSGYIQRVDVTSDDFSGDYDGIGVAERIENGREVRRGCVAFDSVEARKKFDNEGAKSLLYARPPDEERLTAEGQTIVYEQIRNLGM